MRFEVVSEIPFARALVFATFRDRLAELVPYLPNIRAIEVKSRTETEGVVSLENVWHGGGEIPAVARPFLPHGATSWTDFARWDPVAFTCSWSTEPHAFREAVISDGINRYEEAGEQRTRITIAGRVDVDPAKVRGVPRLLAGTVRPTVEHFIVASVKTNMREFVQGVERYLREGRT